MSVCLHVCVPVLREVCAPPEPLPAPLTHMRPLVRVYERVFPQIRRLAERRSARHTRVRPEPCVSAVVHAAFRSGSEALGAGGAGERLLARMDQLVPFQVGGPAEDFATVWTLQRLMLCVRRRVCYLRVCVLSVRLRL